MREPAWSCFFFLETGLLCRSYQIFLSQRLQHLLVALAAGGLLPAPPVESRFVAVDSGHIYLYLLPSRLAKVDTRGHKVSLAHNSEPHSSDPGYEGFVERPHCTACSTKRSFKSLFGMEVTDFRKL